MGKLSTKKQIQLRLRSYCIVRDALENGLGFALNRLQEAAGDRDLGLDDDELRARALDLMLNELMISLEGQIDWDKSG